MVLDADVVTAAVPETVAPDIGEIIETVGPPPEEFCTVIVTGALVVVWPAALRATAVRACWPFAVAVVSQEMENGCEVFSEPRLAPSSLNWTPTGFAEALDDTVVEREIV